MMKSCLCLAFFISGEGGWKGCSHEELTGQTRIWIKLDVLRAMDDEIQSKGKSTNRSAEKRDWARTRRSLSFADLPHISHLITMGSLHFQDKLHQLVFPVSCVSNMEICKIKKNLCKCSLECILNSYLKSYPDWKQQHYWCSLSCHTALVSFRFQNKKKAGLKPTKCSSPQGKEKVFWIANTHFVGGSGVLGNEKQAEKVAKLQQTRLGRKWDGTDERGGEQERDKK